MLPLNALPVDESPGSLKTTLLETQRWLALALAAGRMHIWEWDVRGNRVEVWPEDGLPANLPLLDGTRDSAARVLHPDDAPRVMEAAAASCAGGAPFAQDFRILLTDGQPRWLSVTGQIEFDGDRNPVRMAGTVWDVSDQKGSEETLARTVSRLEATLESTADGILVVDLEGRIVDYNRRFLSIWQFPEDLVPAGREQDLIETPDDRRIMEFILGRLKDPAGFVARVRELYTTPEKSAFDVVEFRDGRVLERYSQPQWDGGRPVGRVWSFRDVTLREQATDALRETRDRLAAMLDALPDLLFEVDADGRIYDYRAPSRESLAVPPEAFLGRAMHEVLPAAAAVIRASLDQAVAEGYHRGSVYSLPLGGTENWYELSIARKAPAANGSVRLIVLVRDITQRKRAEEERQRIEQQMLHAQKLESLGVLAGGIAHDFNNILTGIIGHADLAEIHLKTGGPVAEDIETIRRTSRRAAELVRQMLAYAGKCPFHREPVSLPAVIDDLQPIFQMSGTKRPSIVCRFADGLPAIEADAAQIRQLAMNLVLNACEAIGEADGAVTISIDARDCDAAFLAARPLGQDLPAGTYLCLEVADTGCGMTPETVAKIFDPFFTTKFQGRGLGLAAVYGIVRRHRGAIEVMSTPDHGSVFRVFLPAGAATAPSCPRPSGRPCTDRGEGIVLLIDDEPIVRQVNGAFLEQAGFKVLSAADGAEGLDVFRRNQPQIKCVVLDLSMPHMSGSDVFREIRRLDPHVRVILTSGYPEEEMMRLFAGQDVFAFLAKPNSIMEVIERLKESLRA